MGSKKKICLREIAHARSGDKGSHANIGVIAKNIEAYELIKEKLNAEVVKAFFAKTGVTEVIRFELDNLKAVNFLLKNALGPGGATSLRSDAQGKALAEALLHIQL